MYRIHFDPNVSEFVVQFLVWGVFWATCTVRKKRMDEPLTDTVPVYFDTYADAAKWVSDKGIPEAYEIQHPKRALYTAYHAR